MKLSKDYEEKDEIKIVNYFLVLTNDSLANDEELI